MSAQTQGRGHRETTDPWLRHGVRERRGSEGPPGFLLAEKGETEVPWRLWGGDQVFSLGPGEMARESGQRMALRGSTGRGPRATLWGTSDNRSDPERSRGGEENILEQAGCCQVPPRRLVN